MKTLLLTVAVTVAVTACICPGCVRPSGHDDTLPVPLPRGWPRIELYDTVYLSVAPGSDLIAPKGTRISMRRSPAPQGGLWADIGYPAYDATLYLSDITAADDSSADAALANRLERMSLNTGNLPSRTVVVTTQAGYEAVISVTSPGSLTPIQFVARCSRRIVSGTLTLGRRPLSADSLAPVIEGAGRDIDRLINNLR